MNNIFYKWSALIMIGLLTAPVATVQAHGDKSRYNDDDKSSTQLPRFSYKEVIKLTKRKGIKARLAPQVRFTSPLNNGLVAPGEGLPGAGSFNGTGFIINLKVLTRDRVGVKVNEAT